MNDAPYVWSGHDLHNNLTQLPYTLPGTADPWEVRAWEDRASNI